MQIMFIGTFHAAIPLLVHSQDPGKGLTKMSGQGMWQAGGTERVKARCTSGSVGDIGAKAPPWICEKCSIESAGRRKVLRVLPTGRSTSRKLQQRASNSGPPYKAYKHLESLCLSHHSPA